MGYQNTKIRYTKSLKIHEEYLYINIKKMCNNCTSKKITRSLIFLPCSSLRSYSTVKNFLYLYLSTQKEKTSHNQHKDNTPRTLYISLIYLVFFFSTTKTHTHTHHPCSLESLTTPHANPYLPSFVQIVFSSFVFYVVYSFVSYTYLNLNFYL